MGIHNVKIPADTGSKQKLSDFGIELQKIEIDDVLSKSIIQNKYHYIDKKKTTNLPLQSQTPQRKSLRIKSLGENFESTSLDKSTDLSTGQFEIIGVNNISCRGHSSKKIEQIILRECRADADGGSNGGNNSNRDVILLVKGHGKDDNTKQYSGGGGISSDCFCGRNCIPDGDCGECCCTIQ